MYLRNIYEDKVGLPSEFLILFDQVVFENKEVKKKVERMNFEMSIISSYN